jgi:hypothetical protein
MTTGSSCPTEKTWGFESEAFSLCYADKPIAFRVDAVDKLQQLAGPPVRLLLRHSSFPPQVPCLSQMPALLPRTKSHRVGPKRFTRLGGSDLACPSSPALGPCSFLKIRIDGLAQRGSHMIVGSHTLKLWKFWQFPNQLSKSGSMAPSEAFMLHVGGGVDLVRPTQVREAISILTCTYSTPERLLLSAFPWRGTRNASCQPRRPRPWASRCPLL